MPKVAAGPIARILNGPVHHMLDTCFEHEVVGLLRFASDGGGAVVDPCPVAKFEHREVAERLVELGVTVPDGRNGTRMELSYQVVSVG